MGDSINGCLIVFILAKMRHLVTVILQSKHLSHVIFFVQVTYIICYFSSVIFLKVIMSNINKITQIFAEFFPKITQRSFMHLATIKNNI